jgi:hypothetical protein
MVPPPPSSVMPLGMRIVWPVVQSSSSTSVNRLDVKVQVVAACEAEARTRTAQKMATLAMAGIMRRVLPELRTRSPAGALCYTDLYHVRRIGRSNLETDRNLESDRRNLEADQETASRPREPEEVAFGAPHSRRHDGLLGHAGFRQPGRG